MITKYGYYTVGTIAIIVLVLIVLAFFLNHSTVKYILIIVPSIFLIFTLYFFRDPNRNIPDNKNLLLSPADGKIISIKSIDFLDSFNSKARKISIFMSPLNVHVNRIPIDGKVEYLRYKPGKYIVAFDEKASDNNERMEIGLNTNFGKVLFVQIAGFIARRIVCTLEMNQSVIAGERFGMIKFGSRIDVYFPDNAELLISEGESVYAGETALAKFIN